jgi:uncharacterized membrane protein
MNLLSGFLPSTSMVDGVDYYYRAEISDTQLVRRKLLYGFLTLSAILLFLYSSSRPFSYNMHLYVGIPEYLSLLLFLCLVITLFSYITAGRQKTAYVYKITSRHLITLCRITTVCLLFCALAAIFSTLFLFNRGEAESLIPELVGAGVFLLCALALYLVYKLEKQTPYTKWKNQVTPLTPLGKMEEISSDLEENYGRERNA